MLELYYWPTPNARKVTILLHELGVPYALRPVNITRGAQFDPAFLQISPNNRIPALVDSDGPGAPLALFESGAILEYLADRFGRFLPSSVADRARMRSWLYWQVGGLGPMGGQASHFVNYAPPGNDYARRRYLSEYNRLLGVLDRQLQGSAFIGGGEYTIADMACYPWVMPYRRFEQRLDDFPSLQRWYDWMKARQQVRDGVSVGLRLTEEGSATDEQGRAAMFGQSAASVRRAEQERDDGAA
jgi:GST-like protein